MIDAVDVERYLRFDRSNWAELRAQTPLTLHEKDLEALRGINDRIDLEEVVAIYLPLTRLLNLYVSATQNLHRVAATFLGTISPKMPYVIGIAGSVAVGKSTSARILQALLTRWPEHPRVELITTDGFLYPNAVLESRGIMNRKGFPESYDTKRCNFCARLRPACQMFRHPCIATSSTTSLKAIAKWCTNQTF
jgi:type I pantothenate kinase